MDLNKENMRKIRELIVFTIVILIALWKFTLVMDFVRFIFNIIFFIFSISIRTIFYSCYNSFYFCFLYSF